MRAWTNHQEANFIKLVGQGLADAVIAERIGRTRRAVQRRRYGMGLAKPRRKMKIYPQTVVHHDRLVILKDELLAYYALGWRVSGFRGAAVEIEWTSLREPRTPC